MTSNGRNVTLAGMKTFYGTHKKNLNKDRPILSVAKCRPMILVSRNIRYMRIFPGFRGEGASNIISVLPTFDMSTCLLLIYRHCVLRAWLRLASCMKRK